MDLLGLSSHKSPISSGLDAGGEWEPSPTMEEAESKTHLPDEDFAKAASDGGPMWKIYKDGVNQQEDGSFEAWKETLDFLLVFAGLFSAVLTAFIVEAQKLLEPDWDEINARSTYGLWATAHNVTSRTQPPMNPDEFSPDWRARWSNWLWFTSLMLSMNVALIAILAKQWINQYRWRVRGHVASNRAWAWRHRAFHQALEDFHFTSIISTLPMMIHMSLFAFFTGLAIYLLPLHRPIALFIAVVAAFVFLAYLGLSVVVPILRGDSPMSTPIVDQMQYFGYRVIRTLVWLCRSVARAWSRRSLSLAYGPTLKKARDLEKFLEGRLLAGRHGPRFSGDVLSWLLQHSREYDNITVVLQAIGSLNVYQHYGTFTEDNLGHVRKMIVWRDQVLAERRNTEVSPVERAYVLRAALFVQMVDPNGGDRTRFRLKAVDRAHSDSAHGTPLIRAALMNGRQAIMDFLGNGDVGDGAIDALSRMDKPGLALWSARATELLLPKGRGDHVAPDSYVSLRHLAVLIWSVAHASRPDEHGQHVHTLPSLPLEKITPMSETPYDITLARRITTRAAHLLNYKHKRPSELFNNARNDGWILEAIPIWFEAAETQENTNTRTALQRLCITLLARLASRNAPISDGQLHDLLRAISYFTTRRFASSVWSKDALLGAIELLLDIHQHPDARSHQVDVLTPTCSLFEHFATHLQYASDASMTRMAAIVQLLGKRTSGRRPAGTGVAGVPMPPLTGRISLLYCPPILVNQTEGPNRRAQSLWSCACSVLSSDYDQMLIELANSMANELRPGQTLTECENVANLIGELLWSNRAVRFMLPPHRRDLAVAVAQISGREWGRAAHRLRTMPRAADQSRQLDIERFIEGISTTSHALSAPEVFLRILVRNRTPALRHWSVVRTAIFAGTLRGDPETSPV